MISFIIVDDVSNKGYGRSRALRQFVRERSEFLNEFNLITNGKYDVLKKIGDRDDMIRYINDMDDYVKQKGFKVVKEKAELVNSEFNYTCKVTYTIEW